MALCSLSIGSSGAPEMADASVTRWPAMIRVSLLARAAVPWDEDARVLDPGLALQQRLDQVANNGRRGDCHAVASHQARWKTDGQPQQRSGDRSADQTRDRALDGLVRTDVRRQARATYRAADEVRRAIAHPAQDKQRHHPEAGEARRQ